jgi:hypothetical protein
MDQQQILILGRRLLAVALLFGSAFLYLVSIGSFWALRAENSADLHSVFIILGYTFLFCRLCLLRR